MKFSLIGDSYPAQSPVQSSQRTINWYRENAEVPGSKTAASLLPCPGLKVFGAPLSPASGGMRAALEINGRAFFCGDSALLELLADGTYQSLGALPSSTSPCSMAASTTQLLVAANGDLKVFNLTTNTFAGISDPTGVSQVAYSDGTFFALLADSNQVRFSGVLDASSWDPLDILEISEFPDNAVGTIVDHREIWMLGLTRSVPYVSVPDDLNNPFQPLSNSFVEYGCAARFSIARMDASIFWLGKDPQGQAVLVRLNGYNPQRISNHAFEYQVQQYSRIDDAVAYTFQMNGHSFYRITFPTADATWEYDAATNSLHECLAWDDKFTLWHRHRTSCHIFCFGKHLVGDSLSDSVFEMSDKYLDDAGLTLKRERISGGIAPEGNRLKFSRLRIDMEAGDQTFNGIAEGYYSLHLADANGAVWEITVTDPGIVQSQSSSAAAELFFLDDVNGKSWQLGFNNGTGEITLTQVVPGGYGLQIPMVTSDTQLQSYLAVDPNTGEIQAAIGFAPQRGLQVMISWSDDGGRTWEPEVIVDSGALGDYLKRIELRRLGISRHRIFKISTTDAASARVLDGYVEVEELQ